ncbi:MAG: hypothetical protein MUF78_02170 [Candidatus Edwardsbacteria bacterium]|nr:hypothetical protein [Candidatus Edwardsbacteria bacterium]
MENSPQKTRPISSATTGVKTTTLSAPSGLPTRDCIISSCSAGMSGFCAILAMISGIITGRMTKYAATPTSTAISSGASHRRLMSGLRSSNTLAGW